MSDAPARPIIPVILSGGSGTRLWPLSRGARPKQMLDLLGAGSMLAVTAGRVADEELFSAPVLVAAAGHAEAIEAALPGLGALILEPQAKNTAPAIALAALAAEAAAVLLVRPSDHLIADSAGFRDAVRRALPFAQEGWLVTFGMKAERGETGYGYIERGPALGEGGGAPRGGALGEAPPGGAPGPPRGGRPPRLERRNLPDPRRRLSGGAR